MRVLVMRHVRVLMVHAIMLVVLCNGRRRGTMRVRPAAGHHVGLLRRVTWRVGVMVLMRSD